MVALHAGSNTTPFANMHSASANAKKAAYADAVSQWNGRMSLLPWGLGNLPGGDCGVPTRKIDTDQLAQGRFSQLWESKI